MSSDSLKGSVFEPLKHDRRFAAEAFSHCVKASARVLEIGSGTGRLLVALAEARPGWKLTGVDFSERNVAEARLYAVQADYQDRVELIMADYPGACLSRRFDLILADSVLHLIDAPDSDVYSRLRADLEPGGSIVTSLPYECRYNDMLWTARRLLRHIRHPVVDRLIEILASVVHPRTSRRIIRQRVPYMYLTPYRVDGPKLRDRLMEFGGLSVVESKNLKSRSIGQPRHRLLVISVAT